MQRFQKFMFDNAIFDDPVNRPGREVVTEPEGPPPPPPPPTYEADQVIAARTDAWQAGLDAGLAQAQESLDHQISRALSHLAMVADQWITHETARQAERERDVLDAAIALSKKLFPALAQKNGLDEIKASIIEHLLNNPHEPTLSITLPAGAHRRLKNDIDAALASRGLEGRYQIVEDASLEATACHLSWGDGGKERLVERLWPFFDKATDEVLAGRYRPGNTQPDIDSLPPFSAPAPFILPDDMTVDATIPAAISTVPTWLKPYDPEGLMATEEPANDAPLTQDISLDLPPFPADAEPSQNENLTLEENEA